MTIPPRPIAGPYDDVIRPAHIRLLDYEVESGLVIGREMPVGTTITADNGKLGQGIVVPFHHTR